MNRHTTAKTTLVSRISTEVGSVLYLTGIEKKWRIDSKTTGACLLLFAPSMPENPWVVALGEWGFVTAPGGREFPEIRGMDCWPMTSLENAHRMWNFMTTHKVLSVKANPDLGQFVKPDDKFWLPQVAASNRCGIVSDLIQLNYERWPNCQTLIQESQVFNSGLIIPGSDSTEALNYTAMSERLIGLLRISPQSLGRHSLGMDKPNFTKFSARISSEVKNELKLYRKYGKGQMIMEPIEACDPAPEPQPQPNVTYQNIAGVQGVPLQAERPYRWTDLRTFPTADVIGGTNTTYPTTQTQPTPDNE